MKIIFYRTLLHRAKNITPSERILYSFLVAKSISRLESIFDADGQCLNLDELMVQLKDYKKRVAICELNHSKIASELNQTRKTVINGLKHLTELGYIGKDWIYINEVLIRHGYFELHHTDILTGELLIFYSYLRDKSAKYNCCIDTFKVKLGEQIGDKSKIAITKYLNRLYKLELAERLDNGKLLIK